jgi:battenin
VLPHFSSLAGGQSYQALATEPDIAFSNTAALASPSAHSGKVQTSLTTSEKLALMRPLVFRYMLPLCAVYIEEYIINSVSPFFGIRHS